MIDNSFEIESACSVNILLFFPNNLNGQLNSGSRHWVVFSKIVSENVIYLSQKMCHKKNHVLLFQNSKRTQSLTVQKMVSAHRLELKAGNKRISIK